MADMSDRNWLEGIYQEHRRPLFLTAWNVLRCPSLAEDAVHSAFVRLARLAKPPRDLKLYAFRAVRNAAIDLARGRKRQTEREFDGDDLQPLVGGPETQDESLAAAQSALARLDERSREVVELHLHGGLTFQEIAALCEEPLPTVASRYRRALDKIREILEVCHE
jgi:RNA polymerase sigma-70 factor (ECF subfamily)